MTKVTKRHICHLVCSNRSNGSSACRLLSGRFASQTCWIPTDLYHRNGALECPFQLLLWRSVTPLCSIPFGHKSYWASSPPTGRRAGLAQSVPLVLICGQTGQTKLPDGLWEGKQNLPLSYQGLSAKKPLVVSQGLLSRCCQDQCCHLICLTSFWPNHVSRVRKTRAVWTFWMFLCIFLPMEHFNFSL